MEVIVERRGRGREAHHQKVSVFCTTYFIAFKASWNIEVLFACNKTVVFLK